MNPDGDSKPEPSDPDKTLRLLELELAQRRNARERAGAPYRGFRTASFIFAFVIVVGALFAFYYVFFLRGVEDLRSHSEAGPTATPSAHTP
jgi:hypothetical protein